MERPANASSGSIYIALCRIHMCFIRSFLLSPADLIVQASRPCHHSQHSMPAETGFEAETGGTAAGLCVGEKVR